MPLILPHLDKGLVVILGQDPYIIDGTNSVCVFCTINKKPTTKFSKFYKGKKAMLGLACQSWKFTKMDNQGALLLNAILTVGKPSNLLLIKTGLGGINQCSD